MILIKDDLEFEFKSPFLDTKGRYILIDASVQGPDFLIFTHQITFSGLKTVVEKFNASSEQKIVVGGDFNVAIDSDLDCSSGNPTKKKFPSNVFKTYV